MIKIYIASPITTSGDIEKNVRRQIDASDVLINNGFCPFAPALFYFHDKVHPRSYEDWMGQCFEWVRVCDGILRLSGESKGADREVELAKELNIPVYYDMFELLNAYNKTLR